MSAGEREELKRDAAPLADAPGAPESEVDAELRFQSAVRQRRLQKLAALRARGVEPYPPRFDRDATAAQIRAEHAGLAAGTVTDHAVRLAGRLMGERRHGGL